ncbi:hypothetical protein [Labrys monachus]|uniref:Uncharacterized protein n=1 Tax=Labrys monachus TaxID=217067 RepID=A0ABU0FEM6_9HYPH|nr:hypothetical protein [Labrys monachus]MDQ0393065.1 hypothetical protein [Labrys monachus]
MTASPSRTSSQAAASVPRFSHESLAGGAPLTIDAIACNPRIARSIPAVGADYLLAVKGNQPTLQTAFEAADAGQADIDVDKGHGRIETRAISVLHQVDRLDGDRRFPSEARFLDARAVIRWMR